MKGLNMSHTDIFQNSTSELQNRINKIHSKHELKNYIDTHTASICSFSEYYYNILRHKNISLADAVKASRLEKYAYKILDETKPLHAGRDKILCLCIGAKMNIKETNRCLEMLSLGILYSRNSKDAIIIYHINNNDWSIENINIDLQDYGLELL
jgi:hypothetical protein